MTPEDLNLEQVIEQIEEWVERYIDDWVGVNGRQEAEMRAEGAAVIAWIKQHCGAEAKKE